MQTSLVGEQNRRRAADDFSVSLKRGHTDVGIRVLRVSFQGFLSAGPASEHAMVKGFIRV